MQGGLFAFHWCDPKNGSAYKDQNGMLIKVNETDVAFITYGSGL